MKKIRYELESWDEGRAFMNRLADEVGALVKEINADLRIETDRLTASCHFDDREFSFILIKLQDESLESMVMMLLKQFKKNN